MPTTTLANDAAYAYLAGEEHAQTFIRALSYHPFAGTELFELVASYLRPLPPEAENYLRGYLQRIQQELPQDDRPVPVVKGKHEHG